MAALRIAVTPFVHHLPMDLEPTAATLSQVKRGRFGRQMVVEDDVQGIVNDICALDPSLGVSVNEVTGHFIVWQECMTRKGGVERSTVTTAQELDQRLVARVRQVIHPEYNLVDELDREEARRDRQRDQERYEQIGPVAEKLAWALGKDLGIRTSIIVPRDVGSADS